MRRLWCVFAVCFLGIVLISCHKGKIETEKEMVFKEEKTTEMTKGNPKTYKGNGKEKLLWETECEPLQYEINWTVDGTTETYVRELTSPKYEGRAGGSEGNRRASEWLAEQFAQAGLHQLPMLGSWKQSYQTEITTVLLGKAFLVAPSGEETELKLGEEWAFQASPEEIDVTLTLLADQNLYEEQKNIWDAKVDLRNAVNKLSLTTGQVSKGIYYANASGNPGQVIVTDAIYQQLKQEGYQIHLQLPDAVEEHGIAENVIGYLPGKDDTRAVVLGANFDGPGQCGPLLMPGAYNNASGTATLIQTAKWLSQAEELPCDVIFAAFNTEDNRESGSTAFSRRIEKEYEQIRMINLKCIGWKGQPLTICGSGSEAALRKSLAGGIGLPYVDRDIGGDERAFRKKNMSSVTLFQIACLGNPEISSILNSTSDIADHLDFLMLDDISKKLAEWVIERGDEPLVPYITYW